MYNVKVTVKSVDGPCAAGYKAGDCFKLEGPHLIPEQPGKICIYALGALIPYLTAYCRHTPKEDWINNKKELQCPDNSNTVTFEISRIE